MAWKSPTPEDRKRVLTVFQNQVMDRVERKMDTYKIAYDLGVTTDVVLSIRCLAVRDLRAAGFSM